MNILDVSQLKKYYVTQKAVDGISFSIKKGSIFGLLGPNGAGKTTLIRMITGIIFPDSGEINFNGRKFNPIKDIYNIGYMPEERGLYKKMKIGEQALYLAQLKGLTRKQAILRIKEWFVKFEMESWWNKKVEDLSKGMGQKLQFVITVLHEPELLILDEPFSGLDPVNSNLIKDEIFTLARKGTTIIFSTHRMEQVEEICDEIMLINKGLKVLDGSVCDIKENCKENLFRIGFKGRPQSLSENCTVFKEEKNSLIVKIHDGFKPANILQDYVRKDESIISFNEILPSLNDIFISKVEKTSVSREFQEIIN